MQETKKKKYFFRKLFLGINSFISLLLIVACFASYVSPSKCWWFGLLALSFPSLFIINFLFIIYWVWKKKKYYYFSLVAAIISCYNFFTIFQINFHTTLPTEAANDSTHRFIKVMSYNVHLFDLYDWRNYENEKVRAKILAMLKTQSPDIVCFQEYYSSESSDYKMNNNDTLPVVLGAPYSHIEYTVTLKKTDHFGTATFSRFPIVKKKNFTINQKRGTICLLTDIALGTDTLRVINVHLESFHFQPEDYDFVDHLGADGEKTNMGGLRKIILRMRNAFLKRGPEADLLSKEISRSPYPVILCGDFNDTPSSYSYRVISENLEDAFNESGEGAGKTYIGAFPSFRIDYILHDKKFKGYQYQTVPEKLSDHYAIECWLDLKNKK